MAARARRGRHLDARRDTGDAQIFIDLVDNPRLDHDYTVFAPGAQRHRRRRSDSRRRRDRAHRDHPVGSTRVLVPHPREPLAEPAQRRAGGAPRERATAHRPDAVESDARRLRLPAGSARPARGSRARSRYEPSPLGLPEAREAVARDYARRGIAVPPERIVLTASTSEAYSLLFKLLCDAGDEVLVPRPSYPLFEHLTRLDASSRVPTISSITAAGRSTLAASSARSRRARAPCSSSARTIRPASFVTPDELDRLAELCAPRGIAIIADEVFADYELEPGAAARRAARAPRPTSWRSGWAGCRNRSACRRSKLGWIARRRARTDSSARRSTRLELVCDTYLSVSTPVQVAAARSARARRRRASADPARVAANYRDARSAGRRVRRPAGVLRAEGGWYAVLQVPSLEPEEDLVRRPADRRRRAGASGLLLRFPARVVPGRQPAAARAAVRRRHRAHPAALRLQRHVPS